MEKFIITPELTKDAIK